MADFFKRCSAALLAVLCITVSAGCGKEDDGGASGAAKISASAPEDIDISYIPENAACKCTEYLVNYGEESCTKISYLDDKGNEIREIFYPESELTSALNMENEYDSQGRLVQIRYTGDDEGDIIEYEYLDNGEIGKLVSQVSGTATEVRFEYEYDDQGRPDVVYEYHNDNEEAFSVTYRTYDENGNKSAEKIQYAYGMEFEYTYEYDEKGRVITMNIDDSSCYRYEYEDYI